VKKIKQFIPILLFFLSSFHLYSFADFKNTLPQKHAPETQIQIPAPKSEMKKNEKKNEKKNDSQSTESSLENDISKHNSNAPIYFEGGHAEGSKKTGVLNLIKNVLIIQDDVTLKSEKAQLISTPNSINENPNSHSNPIKQAIATGNVRILKKSSTLNPEIKATCDRVEFDIVNKILTLTGNAKVWRNSEYIHANTIEINLTSGDIHLTEPQGTVDPKSATKKQNRSTTPPAEARGLRREISKGD
jgi:lipopolysaccharide transport protein LptA